MRSCASSIFFPRHYLRRVMLATVMRLGVLPLAVSLVVAALAATAPGASAGETAALLLSLRPTGHDRALAAAAHAVIASAGARIAGSSVPQIGMVVVRPRGGESLRALAGRLRADRRVRAVSAEHRATLRRTPNDPALTTPETASGTPSGTSVEWWPQREGFFRAWDVTTGEGALVGVIDTGIDATHPELAGKVHRTEDLYGNSSHGPGTTDEIGHGTHVSSIACAAADNGAGIVGAGYNCGL